MGSGIVWAIGVAAGAFIATNLDDLVVLTVFFAEAQTRTEGALKTIHVVKGQYLGFSFLVFVSLIGYIVGSFISAKYIGLLGFAPIAIGLKQYYDMWTADKEDHVGDKQIVGDEESSDAEGTAPGTPPINGHRRYDDLGVPILDAAPRSDMDLANHNSDMVSSRAAEEEIIITRKGCFRIFNPEVLRVASMTVANGADNIAVYTALFASSRGWTITITLGAMYVLMGGWCLLAWAFVKLPYVEKAIVHYGDYVIPLLLIALGIFIILGSNTQTLFGLPKVDV